MISVNNNDHCSTIIGLFSGFYLWMFLVQCFEKNFLELLYVDILTI